MNSPPLILFLNRAVGRCVPHRRAVTLSLLLFLTAGNLGAAVHYVNVNSATPSSPYIDWASAATNIQDAIDVAAAGDEVVVTNGVYQTGGRVVNGALTNRVAVTKPITVRSVNGPEVTVIAGHKIPDVTIGDGAVRCVYLVNGSALVGFTLTNGATRASGDSYREQSGGGVWCASISAAVSNCVLTGNSAYEYGGGAFQGTLNNCTLTGNSAASSGGGASLCTLNNCSLSSNSTWGYGGGAYQSTLNSCTLTGNSSGTFGGGAFQSTLNNCALTGNSAFTSDFECPAQGGGASLSTLNNCTLISNWADEAGGGASGGTLNNCTLAGNSAGHDGGGASLGTLNNCTLTGNSAYELGGGAFQGTLDNCTLTGNSAGSGGGGADHATLNNCIVYYNAGHSGGNYDSVSKFNYSCTTPLPANGVGNITNAPAFVDFANGNLRLLPGSPCIDAGADLSAILTNDLDGRPRPLDGDGDGIAAFDMGAYEYRALHVWQESPGPAPPYATWATAATNIQDAIDAALLGDDIVVTNGVYATGGRVMDGAMTNRVAVTKPLSVRSVNGPEVTVIAGYQVPAAFQGLGDSAVRCVYLGEGATLVGFTLTNGATRQLFDSTQGSGGGVWCASARAAVSNCVLTGNSANFIGGGAFCGMLNNCKLTGNRAFNGGGGAYCSTLNNCTLTGNFGGFEGGGAYGGTLNNCTLSGNSADFSDPSCPGTGGGASKATLNNCTLSGNSAFLGGGAARSTLNNCIVYYNVTESIGANHLGATFNYSCTTPLPTNGVGNFDNSPLFVDRAGGNLRLQSNSPCINAGLNSSAPGGTDMDGNTRIVGGTVDVGAYEFQSPQSLISYAWLQNYGLTIDSSTDSADPDGDQLNNWQEWRAGTDPTNAQSVLRLLTPRPLGHDLLVTWESVPGRNYVLERSTDLGATPRFVPLAANLPAQLDTNTTTFAHTNAAGAGPWFYRVGVE